MGSGDSIACGILYEKIGPPETTPDGPQPKMRAFAEDVPMTQTIKDGDIVRWTGSNEYSITMILDLDTNDMTYTMTSKSLANPDSVFTGTCEVQ